MIEYQTGNIFTCGAEALVNPVNTVGTCGKGLALAFKEAFPENFRHYYRECAAGNVKVGKMCVFDERAVIIINFPTKTHWRYPSRLEYIESGLEGLVSVVLNHGIQSIGIPALGSGLGGLDWNQVRPLIEQSMGVLANVKTMLFGPR